MAAGVGLITLVITRTLRFNGPMYHMLVRTFVGTAIRCTYLRAFIVAMRAALALLRAFVLVWVYLG